jgi:hypothetical protein
MKLKKVPVILNAGIYIHTITTIRFILDSVKTIIYVILTQKLIDISHTILDKKHAPAHKTPSREKAFGERV